MIEALHRELHTRDPSARRDLILPVGPSPLSPWGLQGPILPHAQQQGPTLPASLSLFRDLQNCLQEGGQVPSARHEGKHYTSTMILAPPAQAPAPAPAPAPAEPLPRSSTHHFPRHRYKVDLKYYLFKLSISLIAFSSFLLLLLLAL